MYAFANLVASITLLNSLVSAASLRLQFQSSTILANVNSLPPTTHATITAPDGTILRSQLRQDNSIIFPEISTLGSHLLSVYSRDYTFASYRIDTTPHLPASVDSTNKVQIAFAAQLFPGTQWSDTGSNLIPQQPDATSSTGMSIRPQSSLTLIPRVVAQKQFYEERQGFSPLSLLKNPMIIMAVVALGFTFGMPKLMENMDPEMKAEYEEMQKKGPTAALGRAMSGQAPTSGQGSGFDLAGYLAGQKQDGASGLRGKK